MPQTLPARVREGLRQLPRPAARVPALHGRTHRPDARGPARRASLFPKVALQGADTAIAPLMPDDPTASPLYGAVPRHARRLSPPPIARRLEAAGRAAVAESVTPAYARFREFLAPRVHPRRPRHHRRECPARRRGLLPAPREATSPPCRSTSDQVHATGLAEVARIRAEMEGGDARHRLHRRLRRVPEDAAHRSALLSRRPASSC